MNFESVNTWVFRLLEYGLALMFIQGGINIFLTAESQVLPGIFTLLVGQYAIYFYGLFFTFQGLALIYAKIRKRRRLQRGVLLSMYLVCIYVLVLSIAINGLVLGQLTTVFFGLLSAGLWLRWKMKAHYMTHSEVREYMSQPVDTPPQT